MFKRNQAVVITAATGRTETGRIVKVAKWDRPMPQEWWIVRFDFDGAKLCVAATSLQPAC